VGNGSARWSGLKVKRGSRFGRGCLWWRRRTAVQWRRDLSHRERRIGLRREPRHDLLDLGLGLATGGLEEWR
jgi:hypothetical protein